MNSDVSKLGIEMMRIVHSPITTSSYPRVATKRFATPQTTSHNAVAKSTGMYGEQKKILHSDRTKVEVLAP